MLKGVTGKFSQNPPLRLSGARGVMKERILVLRRDVAGHSPNFRGIVKERPLI